MGSTPRNDGPDFAWTRRRVRTRRAIVRNKPDESELIRRVTSTDTSRRMPPASTHKVLSATDVATLRAWITQGAVYEPFWAFTAPRKNDAATVDV